MAAMRPDWLEVRVAVMLAAVRVKFGSNPELRAMLLATSDAEIIEDSPHDLFWGIGRDGQGENRMGNSCRCVRN